MSELDVNVRLEALIGRVVDGEASESEWSELSALAQAQPGVWRDLADAQRVQQGLSAGVAAAVEIAEGVEAPIDDHIRWKFSQRVRMAGMWGGWAAAAAMVMAWGWGGLGLPAAGGGGAQRAGLGLGSWGPDEALRAYLEQGQASGKVLGEMPAKLLLDATPRADGGLDVVYVRQIVEQAVIDGLYRLSTDELGRMVPLEAGRAY